jgi:hypothetical protein
MHEEVHTVSAAYFLEVALQPCAEAVNPNTSAPLFLLGFATTPAFPLWYHSSFFCKQERNSRLATKLLLVN